jgi:cholesterol oxidase
MPTSVSTAAEAAAPISLQFSERMSGHCSPDVELSHLAAEAQGLQRGATAAIEVTVSTPDLQRLVASPEHSARIIGTVHYPGLSTSPLSVVEGTLSLLVQPAPPAPTRLMVYRMLLRAAEGGNFWFEGQKTIKDDPGADLWQDTTTLYFDIYRGQSAEGTPLGRGVLHITPGAFIRQLQTLRAADAHGQQSLAGLLEFGRFFAGELWDVYGVKTPDQTPGRIIPLGTYDGVTGSEITFHPFTTSDGLGLYLTRFRKPGNPATRDAVLLVHGLTASSDMFIMPEHMNLVRYLQARGYLDIWAIDLRFSNRFPYNLWRHRYTFEDIALYDFPPALRIIRSQIGAAGLHVISHCAGALAFSMGLFGGVLEGITSASTNGVALTPRIAAWSAFKLRLAPFLFETLLGGTYLNPRWRSDPGLTLGKLLALAVGLFHHECSVPACHMLSFMWGTGHPALYSHEQLDPLTHERCADLFGPTAMNYYRHLSKMVKAGKAVKYSSHRKYAALPDDCLAAAPAVKTPVLFMTGEHNHIFTDSNLVCFDKLQELQAAGDHEKHVFSGYGHADVIIGKDSHRHTFPVIVDFIDKHRTTAP